MTLVQVSMPSVALGTAPGSFPDTRPDLKASVWTLSVCVWWKANMLQAARWSGCVFVSGIGLEKEACLQVSGIPPYGAAVVSWKLNVRYVFNPAPNHLSYNLRIDDLTSDRDEILLWCFERTA